MLLCRQRLLCSILRMIPLAIQWRTQAHRIKSQLRLFRIPDDSFHRCLKTSQLHGITQLGKNKKTQNRIQVKYHFLKSYYWKWMQLFEGFCLCLTRSFFDEVKIIISLFSFKINNFAWWICLYAEMFCYCWNALICE